MPLATNELTRRTKYGIDHGTGLFPHDPTFSLFRYWIARTKERTNFMLASGSESGYLWSQKNIYLTA